ncbi:hypothetical protein INR49_006623 [Caranx melampygus]|nr:hypothetical protein INR49_006623 [Caranx melampygus]
MLIRSPSSVKSSSRHRASGFLQSEAVETKVERSSRERELDRKRVNSDFLDRLEGRGGARQTPEAERPRQASEDFTQRPSTSSTAGQRVPLAHLKPEPEQSWTQEADPEPDFDWSLMKLMNSFPDCNKAFLEDILHQCNGDYQEAYTLLICTLS